MLIFLDIQTSGLEREDVVCSIALLSEIESLYELVNEGKKIPPQASAIHHITNEMIHNSPKLKETDTWNYLQKYNTREHLLVGHNIGFALRFLENSGFVWQGDIVDTQRVSKHLLGECEEFSLQYLRYELKLYAEEPRLKAEYGIKDALEPYSALGHVIVIKALFEMLVEMCGVDQLRLLTTQKVLLGKFSFGKYQSRYIEEIVMSDRGYIEWMLALEDLDEDLRYSLEYYLQG